MGFCVNSSDIGSYKGICFIGKLYLHRAFQNKETTCTLKTLMGFCVNSSDIGSYKGICFIGKLYLHRAFQKQGNYLHTEDPHGILC